MRKVVLHTKDEAVKIFIDKTLSREGFEISTNGHDGIFILDLTEEKNFSLIESIRLKSTLTPIIVLLSDEEDALQCLKKGADSYILIPFDPLELSIRSKIAYERYRRRVTFNSEP